MLRGPFYCVIFWHYAVGGKVSCAYQRLILHIWPAGRGLRSRDSDDGSGLRRAHCVLVTVRRPFARCRFHSPGYPPLGSNCACSGPRNRGGPLVCLRRSTRLRRLRRCRGSTAHAVFGFGTAHHAGHLVFVILRFCILRPFGERGDSAFCAADDIPEVDGLRTAQCLAVSMPAAFASV